MINIAIMGYGVVGRGTAQVFEENASLIEKRVGDKVNVKYILDLLDFPGDKNESKIIHDFEIIANDPDVSIVAEVMGGRRAAYTFTKRLLEAKKSVVTSNKELVAYHGDELLEIASANGVRYMFEASVGGGIPLLSPMIDSLCANEINAVCGIVNGTSNYILTEMTAGKSFADALLEAQKNGYAEADPTADVEGHDACRKICILAALSFGVLVEPEQVSTIGISKITLDDINNAERENCVIKLIARAARLENGKISLSVAPHKVPKSSPLSGVNGVNNAVLVSGNMVGDVMFYGPGAGSLPTASAVSADIINIAERMSAPGKNQCWKKNSTLISFEEITGRDLEKMKNTAGLPLYNDALVLG